MPALTATFKMLTYLMLAIDHSYQYILYDTCCFVEILRADTIMATFLQTK